MGHSLASILLHCIGMSPVPSTCGQEPHLDQKVVTNLHAHAALLLLPVHPVNRCSGLKISTHESCHLDQMQLVAGLQVTELR